MNKYYAYDIGTDKGILSSWNECEKIIKGKKAKYKKFSSKEEANYWLNNNFKELPVKRGIYFDAGTGGKIGVEVKVVNEKKENLLNKIISLEDLTSKGNHLCIAGTNNYGELLGCYFALKIAKITNIKNIFGDSNLVLSFWSLGKIKKDLPAETIELSRKVHLLRKDFEESGGILEHISGDKNPADLGYHK